MFETKKTLIVVYKDELLMNQLKKMVTTMKALSEREMIPSILFLGRKKFGMETKRLETFRERYFSLEILRARTN